jgi:hypothetical protein
MKFVSLNNPNQAPPSPLEVAQRVADSIADEIELCQPAPAACDCETAGQPDQGMPMAGSGAQNDDGTSGNPPLSTVIIEEPPTERIIRQLTFVKEKLIPFWGQGRTTMEFAAEPSGDISGKYAYQIPDGESFVGDFHVPVLMAERNADNSNPLLKYIADNFREFMLSLPLEIRMWGPGTRYPKDSEFSEKRFDPKDWTFISDRAKMISWHADVSYWQAIHLCNSASIIKVYRNGLLQIQGIDFERPERGWLKFSPSIGANERIYVEELVVEQPVSV